jgi:hypothetical protein
VWKKAARDEAKREASMQFRIENPGAVASDTGERKCILFRYQEGDRVMATTDKKVWYQLKGNEKGRMKCQAFDRHLCGNLASVCRVASFKTPSGREGAAYIYYCPTCAENRGFMVSA